MAYKVVFLLFLYTIENTCPMCTTSLCLRCCNIKQFIKIIIYISISTNGRYSTLGNKNFKEIFFLFTKVQSHFSVTYTHVVFGI